MKISNLTQRDVGRWVEYHSFGKQERGRIKSWNDKWVFVVYNCDQNWDRYQDYTGCATDPEDLVFSQLLDETPEKES